MNRINKHDLEPGAYIDDQNFTIVVIDIVDHSWNTDKQLLEFLLSPMVVCRDLVNKDETRYMWPIEVFKTKFKKHE